MKTNQNIQTNWMKRRHSRDEQKILFQSFAHSNSNKYNEKKRTMENVPTVADGDD